MLSSCAAGRLPGKSTLPTMGIGKIALEIAELVFARNPHRRMFRLSHLRNIRLRGLYKSRSWLFSVRLGYHGQHGAEFL